MRKCEHCGYLLPEAWDTCKRCDTPVVPASVGAAPVAATAPPAAASPAPTAWARPAASPAAGAGGFDARYSEPARIGFASEPSSSAGGWAPPPTVMRPVTRRSRLPVALVLLAAVLVAGGWFGWQWLRAAPPLPAEAKAYIDGAGIVHEPFGQGYRVRLPKQPIERTETITQAGISVTYTEAFIEYDGRYEIRTGAADLGITIPPDLARAALDEGARSVLAEEPGTKLLDTKHLTFAGRPAMDARFKAPDGNPARAFVVLDGSRIVVVFTHATSQNDALFEAVRDSLEITL